MYKAIIFDFFGVVTSEVATPWLLKEFSPDKALKIRETYIKSFDLGNILEQDLLNQLSKVGRRDPGQIREEWNNLLILNEPVISLVKNLKKNYKIGLCTNAGTPFFEEY